LLILDLDVVPIENQCSVDSKQVVLTQNSVNACFGETVTLASKQWVQDLPVFNKPSGPGSTYTPSLGSTFSLEVYDNPNHNGQPIQSTKQGGSYYFFLKDKLTGCYNTNNASASAILNVVVPNEKQVELNVNQIVNTCTGTTANLMSTFTKSPPAGYELVWYKDAQHTSGKVQDPISVSSGTYYAFFYNPVEKCFLTHNSTSKVVVQIPADQQVILKGAFITVLCPGGKANLNSMVDNIPASLSLI
jgi:hypothetical protein